VVRPEGDPDPDERVVGSHPDLDHVGGGIVVYTWGYQGDVLDTLAALRAERNALIVDVRYVPSSRDARWRQRTLERRFGVDYLWLKAFGNRNYKGESIILDAPELGLAMLEPFVSPDHPPLLLCMCPTTNCHRTAVAAFLAAQRGWTIEHLPQRGA
jgi:Protein of unknown function, DUF488